jgi:hypothetical protein
MRVRLRPPRKKETSVRRLLAIPAILLISSLGLPARAGASAPTGLTCDGAWHRVAAPPAGGEVRLNAVVTLSPTDAWAVGKNGTALIEHWDGVSWSVFPGPTPRWGVLESVAAVAPNDVWAVGHYTKVSSPVGIQETLTEHFNGKVWRRVPSPSPGYNGNDLDSVAVGRGGPWAVGTYYTPGPTLSLAERFVGGAWTVVPTPNDMNALFNSFSSVRIVSANDVWAIASLGAGGGELTHFVHWDGSSFSDVAGPPVAFGGPFNIAVISASDLLAVGFQGDVTTSPETQTPIVEGWDGASWTLKSSVASPWPSRWLSDVSAFSPTGAWAIGGSSDPYHSGNRTLIERWDGTGWRIVHSQFLGTGVFSELTSVSARGHWAWTVGWNLTRSPVSNRTQALIEGIC